MIGCKPPFTDPTVFPYVGYTILFTGLLVFNLPSTNFGNTINSRTRHQFFETPRVPGPKSRVGVVNAHTQKTKH